MSRRYRLRTLALALTAAGVVVHELAHKTVAEDFGLRVEEVVLFRLGDPAGYVVHQQPRGYVPSFAVSTAPFLFNSLAALAGVGLGTVVLSGQGGSDPTAVDAAVGVALAWFGISCAVHAFPSLEDARNVWAATKRNPLNPVALLCLPLVGLLYGLDRLRPYGAHYLYAACLSAVAYGAVALLAPAYAPGRPVAAAAGSALLGALSRFG